jgi:antitoxin HicB
MPGMRNFAVVLEPDDDGDGFTVIVPALPGVVTEGDTVEEALANARDAINLCLEDLAEQGVEIPQSDIGTRLERIEVAIAS